MITDTIASTPNLNIAEVYTKGEKSFGEGNTLVFNYPEGKIIYPRSDKEYVTFPVAYDIDVREGISAIVSLNPKDFEKIEIHGKVVENMTVFVVISTAKSAFAAQTAMSSLVHKMGFATIPFAVKGDIFLDEDFLAEEEDIYADGIAACVDAPIEEPEPINPALEEAYASLEKAELELSADPTSKSKARRVMMCQSRVAELGGEL